MNKYERDKYFKRMEEYFSCLTAEDQMKMDFVRNFINVFQLFDTKNGNRISLGPTDIRIFEYFVLSILLEYDRWNQKSEIEKITSD
jgi:hypothetical protein